MEGDGVVVQDCALCTKGSTRLEVPTEEHDVLASQIVEALDDEEVWVHGFRENPVVLRTLASEAMDEHGWGETRLLDEPIG